MPLTKVDSEAIVERLTKVFQTVGYDGATLSRLSAATGLQRASLYHRFPGGKKEMAEVVLSRAEAWIQANILGPLGGSGAPEDRLDHMIRQLHKLYSRGGSPCLLDSMSFGEGGDIFGLHIKKAFSRWIDALTRLVIEEKACTRKIARERAEEVVVRIQGALVLARGTGDRAPFRRMLEKIPDVLLESEAR